MRRSNLMDNITVDKADLIATLRDNRDKHRDLFDKAQVVYREKMIEELDRALAEAKAGRKIRRAFTLPTPENHTEDFDTAIQMLEWEAEDYVSLSMRDFMRYVQNRWEWERSFAANTESYSSQLDAAYDNNAYT
jgi:hypothetical protein